MPKDAKSSGKKSAHQLATHLKQLSASPEKYDDESTLLRQGVMPLLVGLGYSHDEVFFDYSIPWLSEYYLVDVAVASNRRSRPWLLVEIKAHSKPHELKRRMDVLSGLANACGARAVVLLTQNVLSVATAAEGFRESHSRLDAMTDAWANDLFAAVGRDSLQNVPAGVKAPFFSIAVKEPSGRFAIDRTVLEQKLDGACAASAAAEKGDVFEDLANYMLSGLSCVETRKRNVATVPANWIWCADSKKARHPDLSAP